MKLFDFHTHWLSAPPGEAIVCLPRHVVEAPEEFLPQPGALYSVGVHPWWTADDCGRLLVGAEGLCRHRQVVAIGEVGFDRLRGSLERQVDVFRKHAEWAEELSKPLTIHCVRAFDVLLRLRAELRPTVRWTVHGFRGKASLACQLLEADFDLSFGPLFNAEALKKVPEGRFHVETDDSGLSIEEVWRRVALAKNQR